jgi:hypothetical protein
VHGRDKKMHINLVKKEPLGGPRDRKQNIIKMNLKVIGWKDMD